MVTEDYVSFEIAKLLKEKGFDEPCYAYWHEDENRLIFSYSMHAIRNIINPCFFGPAAPTHQMAMKWLREVHNIFCIVLPFERNWTEILKSVPFDTKSIKYHSDIFFYEEGYGYRYTRLKKEFPFNSYKEFNTYEDAVEATIKYCLENLI